MSVALHQHYHYADRPPVELVESLKIPAIHSPSHMTFSDIWNRGSIYSFDYKLCLVFCRLKFLKTIIDYFLEK